MLLTTSNIYANKHLILLLLFLKRYSQDFVHCAPHRNYHHQPQQQEQQIRVVNSTIATTTATSITTTSSKSAIITPPPPPTLVAFAFCSKQFLQELVHHKETCNEKYYHFDEEGINEMLDTTPHRRNNPTHAVEYTGKLWFLRKTPLQFQESIRIKQISSCGNFSCVECVTKLKYGAHSEWTPCCTVLCNLSQTGFDLDGKPMLNVKVSSNVLLQLPLLGARKTISKQICHVFTKAAHSFLLKKETTNMVGCKYTVT